MFCQEIRLDTVQKLTLGEPSEEFVKTFPRSPQAKLREWQQLSCAWQERSRPILERTLHFENTI